MDVPLSPLLGCLTVNSCYFHVYIFWNAWWCNPSIQSHVTIVGAEVLKLAHTSFPVKTTLDNNSSGRCCMAHGQHLLLLRTKWLGLLLSTRCISCFTGRGHVIWRSLYKQDSSQFSKRFTLRANQHWDNQEEIFLYTDTLPRALPRVSGGYPPCLNPPTWLLVCFSKHMCSNLLR